MLNDTKTMHASEIKMFLILVLHRTSAFKHVTEIKYYFFFFFFKNECDVNCEEKV